MKKQLIPKTKNSLAWEDKLRVLELARQIHATEPTLGTVFDIYDQTFWINIFAFIVKGGPMKTRKPPKDEPKFNIRLTMPERLAVMELAAERCSNPSSAPIVIAYYKRLIEALTT